MGISLIIIMKHDKCNPFCYPIIFFGIQLFLNLIWSNIFFKQKNPKLALLDLILIIIFTIITIIQFYKISIYAAYLLIPYILWLLFALYLNVYIVTNN